MAWVTIDGEYGGSAHMSFDGSKLSEDQWEKLENMADSDRYDYVDAILNDNPSIVKLIEGSNFD